MKLFAAGSMGVLLIGVVAGGARVGMTVEQPAAPTSSRVTAPNPPAGRSDPDPGDPVRAAGSGARTDKPLEPVRLLVKWKPQFQFAGYYVARERGYYRAAGLDVVIVHDTAQTDIAGAVLQNSADFGVTSAGLVRRRMAGDPVVALAALFQHSPAVILTRADSGIGHVHGLENKRVMLEANADELDAYLAQEKVGPFDRIRHTYSAEALIDGTVDAMSAYLTDEPFTLDGAGVRYHTFSPRSASIDFYGDVLFTTERTVRARPYVVRAFLEASLRGWKEALADIDAAADVIVRTYGERDKAHLVFEGRETRKLALVGGNEVGTMTLGRWNHIADTFAQLGPIPKSYSLEGFMYRQAPALGSHVLEASLVAIGFVASLLGLLGPLRLFVLWIARRAMAVARIVSSVVPGVRGRRRRAAAPPEGAGPGHSGWEDKRNLLSSFFVTYLVGIAFAEMVGPVKESIRFAGTSSDTALLVGSFFVVAVRFYVGNQLHLLSASTVRLAGIPWLFDLMMVIAESIAIIFLASYSSLTASREAGIGFVDILALLLALDVAWIAAQWLLSKTRLTPQWRRADIPKEWLALNVVLLGMVWSLDWVFGTVYGTAGLTALLAINIVGFLVDVALVDHYRTLVSGAEPQNLKADENGL